MSFGRTKIYSDAKEITAANIQIVNEVLKNRKATGQSILISVYLTAKYIENPYETQKSAEDRRRNIMHYIRFLESKFDYVRYNVFRQRFEFFHVKENAEELAVRQTRGFQAMLASDSNKMVEAWFPNSNIVRELSAKERAIVYIKNLIGKYPYIELSKTERETHCAAICNILQVSMSSFQSVLHRIDPKFNCIESGNKYILYYGENDPRIKKVAMKKRRKR